MRGCLPSRRIIGSHRRHKEGQGECWCCCFIRRPSRSSSWSFLPCCITNASDLGKIIPTPVATKTGPMPTHERLGPDDCENLQDLWKPAIQLDKEPAIIVREPDATM